MNPAFWDERTIPQHWIQKKLKYVASLQSGDTISPEAIRDEGEFPVYGGNGFRGYTSAYTHSGDYVLIGRQGALCGNVNYASNKFWASEHAIVADTKGKANVRWLGELLRALNLNRLSQSAAQPGLAVDVVANISIPVPPPDEQKAIADYLDRETARLDALIAAKERLLGLLAEKRQSLITRAVTRGLAPNCFLRDSGIPWLGPIPAGWAARRIAWLFRERDYRGEPELPLLEVSINTGVALREFSDEKIESTAADFNTYKVARQGDVVFNKMRMWQGAVGVAPEDGLVSPDYVVAAPTGALTSEYAGLLFRTPVFSAECGRRSHGIVWDRLRLYWEEFRDISVPLPSLTEQAAILAYVAQETRKIDDLASGTSRTIALLKERRSALIAAAVTGQITV